jgi:hypothetical protein
LLAPVLVYTAHGLHFECLGVMLWFSMYILS